MISYRIKINVYAYVLIGSYKKIHRTSTLLTHLNRYDGGDYKYFFGKDVKYLIKKQRLNEVEFVGDII